MELPGTIGPVEPYGSGRGFLDHVLLTAPAAGAPLIFKLDSTYVWRPLSIRFQVDTDANVANRFVSLDYTDAEGNVWVRNAPGLVLTASTVAAVFDFNAQRAVAEWATNTDFLCTLSDFFIPGGWQIRVNLSNIQVGDAITNARFYGEKWVSGVSSARAPVAGGGFAEGRGGR